MDGDPVQAPGGHFDIAGVESRAEADLEMREGVHRPSPASLRFGSGHPVNDRGQLLDTLDYDPVECSILRLRPRSGPPVFAERRSREQRRHLRSWSY
jgi:hypothetical protein